MDHILDAIIQNGESGQEVPRVTLVVDGVFMSGTLVAAAKALRVIPELANFPAESTGRGPADLLGLVNVAISTNGTTYHLPAVFLRRSAVSLVSVFAEPPR